MYIRNQTGGEWEGEVATEDWGCCGTFVNKEPCDGFRLFGCLAEPGPVESRMMIRARSPQTDPGLVVLT